MSVLRSALITGASSGIGAALVERLLRDGWHVTGVARRKTAFPGSYTSVEADLSTDDGCDAAIAASHDVSAFVHAAGVMRTGKLGALDQDDSEDLWRLHVRASERIANALAPRLPRGGRILLIGSRAAAGLPDRGQYGASKAALVAMARAWAGELVSRGITVNVIAPAATETPMLQDPQRSSAKPVVPPIGRLIKPEEIAATAAFLLSPHADAITGQVLTICGGTSL